MLKLECAECGETFTRIDLADDHLEATDCGRAQGFFAIVGHREPTRSYFDVVRSMTDDPKILKAVDEAEREAGRE